MCNIVAIQIEKQQKWRKNKLKLKLCAIFPLHSHCLGSHASCSFHLLIILLHVLFSYEHWAKRKMYRKMIRAVTWYWTTLNKQLWIISYGQTKKFLFVCSNRSNFPLENGNLYANHLLRPTTEVFFFRNRDFLSITFRTFYTVHKR